MSNLHIHAPKATAKFIKKQICLDCKKRSLFLEFFTPWYGIDTTCINCGRTWGDGKWCPLEFYRYARRDNIIAAKKLWRSMPPMGNNNFGGINEQKNIQSS